MAVLFELKNGRKLMQFVTGLGVLGFAGAVLDRTNPTMTLLPIDRLHPIRDIGTSSDEQLARASTGEGALDGAEGSCFFEAKDLMAVKAIACVSKYENGNIKDRAHCSNEGDKCHQEKRRSWPKLIRLTLTLVTSVRLPRIARCLTKHCVTR